MIASYPMYLTENMQASLTRWWAELNARLKCIDIVVPELRFSIQEDLYAHWLSPELFFSQTCGYPLVSELKGQVKLIGTPEYYAPGSDNGRYCSFYIVRDSDSRTHLQEFQGARFTFNGPDSQSGFNAVRMNLLAKALELPFFGDNICSGGHRQSIINVANNIADICAVDCVTHAVLKKHQPEVLAGTRILSQTKLTPGLPLITSVQTDDLTVATVFDTIKQMCADESLAAVHQKILLKDIKRIALDDYYQQIDVSRDTVSKL